LDQSQLLEAPLVRQADGELKKISIKIGPKKDENIAYLTTK
jgi:hypothetical protein